jgi:uncharacterized protein YuzE
VRDEKVILDSDLARIYGVETRRLNEQVRRNRERFPEDFAFRLTREEFNTLISQNATSSSRHGGRRKLPFVFTEHGAIMAANVLQSERAVQMSVFVVRAFIKMRETLVANKEKHCMEEITILEDVKNLNWDYDEDADVLYLSIGEPQPALGMDIGEGVVVRYNEQTRNVVGLTIIGMKEKILAALKQ